MSSQTINWDAGRLAVTLTIDEHQVVRISEIRPHDAAPRAFHSPYFKTAALPLVELRTPGEGAVLSKGEKSLVGTQASLRLQYVSNEIRSTATHSFLTVLLRDTETGLEVKAELSSPFTAAAIRGIVTVTNASAQPVTLQQVASLSIGGLTDGEPGVVAGFGKPEQPNWRDAHRVLFARNSWFREAQWQEHTLGSLGIDDIGLYPLYQDHECSMSTFSVSNRGMFSTEGHLPLGVLRRTDDTSTWIWQVENNGSWRWELGECRDSLYVALSGPTATDHEWSTVLPPGESFTSVPAVICHAAGGIDAAFAELTAYRRSIIRPHPDHARLPIIFNDYMNCLMGSPTAAKVEALIEHAALAGARYFCIDAGWYADVDDWWAEVGDWQESAVRFPHGLRATIDRIRARGLLPGLWLEPEVVGVRSAAARELPDACFFTRGGRRVLERQRHQLDFTHAAARQHVDATVVRLIETLDIRYFKFDYNVNPVQGTDRGGTCSPGEGQLAHNRAWLAWLGSLLDRYPDLVVENCASGGQRMDYALLGTLPLQSTSDQQDAGRYAAIAAALPTAVLPEQSASWCYPQPDWTDEEIVFTVVNSMLGRVHLSGRIDLLSQKQLVLLADGLAVHKSIRHDLPTATAFWPLGLPKWDDGWLALGMKCRDGTLLLSVWRRDDVGSCEIPLPSCSGSRKIEVLYPHERHGATTWSVEGDVMTVALPAQKSARFFRITTV